MGTQATTRSRKARVLFVDDSRLMRACAARILSERFELVLAGSAEEAWAALDADEGIEAVFTDLHLPGESGFELLERIRATDRPELAELPVVLVTGEEDGEKVRRSALSRGATDFIAKPFQASELLARAGAYARSGHSTRRLRLIEQAHHIDPETGLGNRHYCEERLIQAMSFARRHRQPLAMMHLKLEGLTELLADMGRPHAERALARIGDTLASRVRREDNVFRSAPECFTFLLPATDADGARALERRFMPDLGELGLLAEDEALAVRAGFVVHTPRPLDGRDAAEIIEAGLSGQAQAPDSAPGSRNAPDLEQALRLIRAGRGCEIESFRSEIRNRVQPVLQWLEGDDGSSSSAPRRRT